MQTLVRMQKVSPVDCSLLLLNIMRQLDAAFDSLQMIEEEGVIHLMPDGKETVLAHGEIRGDRSDGLRDVF